MTSTSPRSLTRAEVRRVDEVAIRDFGMPGIVLMENAGRGAAELLASLGIAGRVVICAGHGNNGGDGFVIARHLENRGCDVRVLLFADPVRLSVDAATNWTILEAADSPRRVIVGAPDASDLESEFRRADWIVDALLGTGTTGGVREPFRTVIERINASGRRVFAVDLPSGLDCDTGLPLGPCVRAQHTATFVAWKSGFDVPGSEAWTGAVTVVDIGVPRALLDRLGATT